jgi:predicted small integral membrane protein
MAPIRLLSTGCGAFFGLASGALAQQGWGQLKTEAPAPPFWTRPLFDGFWMAWTPATIAFFGFIGLAIAAMGVLEWRHPGGAPRHGILGLTTTRGDRLFIGLLGSAYIFMAWIAFFGVVIWGALALAVAWIAFCFWKV